MSALLPGATVGVIGGGQLARMMALEARRMGYRIAVLTPESTDPTVSLADTWIQGSLDDPEAAARLAEASSVVTVDTEHVPASMLEKLEPELPVRPSSSVLHTVQDRRLQREFLNSIDVEQPNWRPVGSREDFDAAVADVGVPCVLKRSHAGYDGKGQRIVKSEADVDDVWTTIGGPSIVEEFVSFDCEVSVLLARNPGGEVRFYPMAHNIHRQHVLRTTVAPANVSEDVASRGFDIGTRIANALDLVGMLAIEMYLVGGEKLLVNELAPRPHNSGHYTFGACATSQFEQHVRAVLGLPLGDTSLLRPAAMVNLFGDLWNDGTPNWIEVLSQPETRLHLYDKVDARPGRKMGHILVLNDDPEVARKTGETLLARLEGSPPSDDRQRVA
jgi:5-(carboxyamino)imidazole ribonucleotide synthase